MECLIANLKIKRRFQIPNVVRSSYWISHSESFH